MAKIFVYSISLDSEVYDPSADTSKQIGFIAGSRALDSLEKLIKSAESYFHPSNTGPWTQSVSLFSQLVPCFHIEHEHSSLRYYNDFVPSSLAGTMNKIHQHPRSLK